jgi:hypothetical protein
MLHQDSGDITLRVIFNKAQAIWRYLISQKAKILIAGIIGASVGLGYAFLLPKKFTSTLSFVVEEGRSNEGGLSSLAGQFGVDIGGGGAGGVFSGENILLFLKSEGLVRQTLLTQYDSIGKVTLADRYADVKGLKKKWQKKPIVGSIDFSIYSNGVIPRKEDSLIQSVVSEIIEKDLIIDRPEKKATLVQVKVTTEDELFSKLFSERLVKVATDRYIETKTKTKALNVAKLQHRADSLSAILDNKTYLAATSQQALVDANPALRTTPIASEISSRDKALVGVIFSEVVKNLELSKTILNQETPVIQIVNQSTLPLKVEETENIIGLIIGWILATFLMVCYLIAQKWMRLQLSA